MYLATACSNALGASSFLRRANSAKIETSQSFPSEASTLTPKQRAALALLVQGATFAVVSEKIGVDRRTLFEWRRAPEFAAALDAELRALREAGHARMASLA